MYIYIRTSPIAQQVKNPHAMQGTQEMWIFIPEWRRSPGGGKGNPLQYYCLKNPWTEETVRL